MVCLLVHKERHVVGLDVLVEEGERFFVHRHVDHGVKSGFFAKVLQVHAEQVQRVATLRARKVRLLGVHAVVMRRRANVFPQTLLVKPMSARRDAQIVHGRDGFATPTTTPVRGVRLSKQFLQGSFGRNGWVRRVFFARPVSVRVRIHGVSATRSGRFGRLFARLVVLNHLPFQVVLLNQVVVKLGRRGVDIVRSVGNGESNPSELVGVHVVEGGDARSHRYANKEINRG